MQNELRNISRRGLRSPKIRRSVAISIVYLASLKQNGNETLSFVFDELWAVRPSHSVNSWFSPTWLLPWRRLLSALLVPKQTRSIEITAKLQNTGPLIYILLNHNSAYCFLLRSSKDFDTCTTGGPKWPYIPRSQCESKLKLALCVVLCCKSRRDRN